MGRILSILTFGFLYLCLPRAIEPASAQAKWETLPGAASDIALADDGTIWTIGAGNANKVPGGYRIFRSEPSNVQLAPVGGAALRIAAEGITPWIVNETGGIQRWNAGQRQWQAIAGPPKAIDIGASAKGVWLIAEPKRGDDYSIYQWTGGTWRAVSPGAGSRVDVDADGNPWVVSSAGLVHAQVGGQWRQFGLARDAQGQYDTGSDIAVDVFGAPWVVSKRGDLWYFNKGSSNPDKWEKRAQTAIAVAERAGRTVYLGVGNTIFRSPNIAVSLANPQLNVPSPGAGDMKLTEVTPSIPHVQLTMPNPSAVPQTTLPVNVSPTTGELKEGLGGPAYTGPELQIHGCVTVAAENAALKAICEGNTPRGETPAVFGETKYREPGLAAFLDQGGASSLERLLGNPALVLGILNDPKTDKVYATTEQAFEVLCAFPTRSHISRTLMFTALLEVIRKQRSQRTPDEQRFYDAVATYLKRRKLFVGEVAQQIYIKWEEEKRKLLASRGRSALTGAFNLDADIPKGQLTPLEAALPIAIAGAGAVVIPIVSIAQAWPVFIKLFPHAGKVFELTGTTGLSGASGLLGKLAAAGGIAAAGAFAIVGSTVATLKVVRAEEFYRALDKAIADGHKPVELEKMVSTKAGLEELAFWWLAATHDLGNNAVTFRADGDLEAACRTKSMNPAQVPAAVRGGRFERGPATPGGYDALAFSNLKFAGSKTTLAESVWKALVIARANCFDGKKLDTYLKGGVASCAPQLARIPVSATTAQPAAATASALTWSAVSGRVLPPAALVAGKHKSGASLVVCRADMGDGIHPGKVWGANCIVGWAGREVGRPTFEVLSAPQGVFNWVPMRQGQALPAQAVVAGKHRSGPNLVVCRADMGDGVHPGKVWNGNCHVGWGGREMIKPAFDVLVSIRAQ